MPLRAAFFDVGDTLVEHWAPRDVVRERMRAQICAGLGETDWLDDLVAADLEPVAATTLAQELASGSESARLAPEWSRQETHEWLRTWFRSKGVATDGIDLDRLRSLMCVPLAEVSTPVPGAFDALAWCARRGLRIVLVTNTLTRGDAEVLEDWERFGVGATLHGVVSSHDAGWRKPHPSIFERALDVAGVAPSEAFHVGDNLLTDVYGAKQVGLRAIWRRKSATTSDPGRLSEPAGPSDDGCRHPSDFLTIRDGRVMCTTCGQATVIRVRPDAVIDDLTTLPAAVQGWLA